MIKIIKKYKEIISYLFFGFLTVLINLITYYTLIYTILNPNKPIQLAITNIISWIVCVTFAYWTNKKYVFNIDNKFQNHELINFYKYRLITLGIEIVSMYILVNKLHFNSKIIKIIIQILIIVLNYIFSKVFVFKKGK